MKNACVYKSIHLHQTINKNKTKERCKDSRQIIIKRVE